MLDDSWRILATVHEWIRFADVKAGGSLAGAGVLAGALASAGLADSFSNAPPSAVGFGTLSGLCALVAAVLALLTLKPRISIGEPSSLIFFDHISKKYNKKKHTTDPYENYSIDLKSLLKDDQRVFDEVSKQILANSTVARKKFTLSGWSLAALAAGVFSGGIAAIITLF